jgi:hypothetical protein
MNLPQIAGIAESTLLTVAPLVLAALAATNPGVAAALPVLEGLIAAVKALQASGVFSDEQATGAVNQAVQAVVVKHVAVAPAA